MKFLGRYLTIIVVCIAFFSCFLPSQVYAQTSQQETQTIRQRGLEVIQKQIDYLIAKQANPDVAKKYGGLTAPGYISYVTENKKVVDKLNNGKDIFTSVFESAIKKGTNPDSAYTAGLTQVQNDLFGINSTAGVNKVAEINADISVASRAIINASTEKIDTLRYSSNELEVANAKAIAENARKASKEAFVERANPNKCSFISPDGNLLGCIDQLASWFIQTFLINFAGVLLWATANLFNYSIKIGILDFAKWAPDTLYPIWMIIRQIISLFVVFAGLYLGFMYIVGKDQNFGKYMSWLVIFALFVNFSYPMTRALIDVSNIISLNVYASAVGGDALVAEITSQNTAGALIMAKLGLQGLVLSAEKTDTASIVNAATSVPVAILVLGFVLYAAYIFFMVTALMVMRTVSLVFIIVASPILLIDSVIPKLGDKAAELRKVFLDQLIVGPVFMIMLALTLKFLTVFSGATGGVRATGGALATSGAGAGTTIAAFFNVLMMLIMLHFMLKVTKATAGALGDMATNAMGKYSGLAMGGALGVGGYTMRKGIGGLAARARDSEWMDKMKSSKSGRGLYSFSKALASSSFDARNVGLLSRGMGSAGMNLGKGSQSNYNTMFKEKKEKDEALYESIKDETTRGDYYRNKKNSFTSKALGAVGIESSDRKIARGLDAKELSLKKQEQSALAEYASADETKRESLMVNAKAGDNYALIDKLEASKPYFRIKGTTPENIKALETGLASMNQNTPEEKRLYNENKAHLEREKKAFKDSLVEDKAKALLLLNDRVGGEKIIENDPFADIKKENDARIKQLQREIEDSEDENPEVKKKKDEIKTKKEEWAKQLEGVTDEAKRKELTEKKDDELGKLQKELGAILGGVPGLRAKQTELARKKDEANGQIEDLRASLLTRFRELSSNVPQPGNQTTSSPAFGTTSAAGASVWRPGNNQATQNERETETIDIDDMEEEARQTQTPRKPAGQNSVEFDGNRDYLDEQRRSQRGVGGVDFDEKRDYLTEERQARASVPEAPSFVVPGTPIRNAQSGSPIPTYTTTNPQTQSTPLQVTRTGETRPDFSRPSAPIRNAQSGTVLPTYKENSTPNVGTGSINILEDDLATQLAGDLELAEQ